MVNAQDKEGLTPLHWAVMSDQASHIRLLLTSTSADVSIQDKEGRTPLNYAVLNFSPPCIRVSLSTIKSIIIVRVMLHEIFVTKAIADNFEGALNVIDAKGRTVLHYACAEGHAECVRTLLSYHRFVNKISSLLLPISVTLIFLSCPTMYTIKFVMKGVICIALTIKAQHHFTGQQQQTKLVWFNFYSGTALK